MVKFPAEETGRLYKLSQPWHGPYQVTEVNRPDVSVSKVYYPQDRGIQVQGQGKANSSVKPCPPNIFFGTVGRGEDQAAPLNGLNNF